MIILITEWDKETNCEVVSHGIDEDTGQNIVLPWMPPGYFKAIKDFHMGHWILPNDPPRVHQPVNKFT